MTVVRRPQAGATGTGFFEGEQGVGGKKVATPVRQVGKSTGPKGGKGGKAKKGNKVGY